MNYKRRKRRRGGIKGCCGMCMLYTRVRVHQRIPTRQEQRAALKEKEQIASLAPV